MGLCMRLCRLMPTFLRRYWIMVAWTALCSLFFYLDYMHYKRQPQFYYTRRMLGVGLCVSRGSAAVLNLSCFAVVLPMCRALATTVGAALAAHRRRPRRPPALPSALTAPATHAAKSTHIMVAVTVLVSTVVHTGAHMANAVNFSRHYSSLHPELNLANYRGENPLGLFVGTVPGVTGVMMVAILVILGITSNRWARRRNYDLFFYVHHLGLLFLLLLIVHPLSGVLKEQKNLHGHNPGCQMYGGSNTDGEGFPEPGPVTSSMHSNQIFTNPEKMGRGSNHTPQHRNHSAATHSETGYPEPDPDYGYPETDLDYGFPEPDPDFGYPEPDADYHFPEPDAEYDYPEPDLDYGFPEPDPDYGYPEPDADYGFPEPDPDYGFPESDPEYGFPEPEPDLNYRSLESNPYSVYPKLHVGPNCQATEYGSGNTDLHSADKDASKERGSDTKTKKVVCRQHRRRKYRRRCLKAPIFGSINSRTWLWVGVALIVWAADWAVRKWRQRANVEVLGVVHHPCDVVEITLKQPGFSCIPGQYVLVQCPKVSRLEWHPFTVTFPLTQQHADTFTIFMRIRGDWSSRVAALLYSDNKSGLQTCTVQQPNSDSQANCSSLVESSPRTISSPLIQSSLLTCSHFRSQSVSHPHSCSCKNKEFSHIPHCSHDDLCMLTKNKVGNYSFLPNKTDNKVLYFSKRKCTLTRDSQINSRSNTYSISEEDNLSSHNSALPFTRTPYRHLRTLPSRPLTYPKNQFLQQCSRSKITNSHSCYVSIDTVTEECTPCRSKKQACTQVGNSQPDIHTSPLAKFHSDPVCKLKNYPQSSTNWSSNNGNRSSTHDRNHQIIHIPVTSNLRLNVDGPFSSPSENMLHYPVVIGTAGGVGITPLAATLSHILWYASPWPKRIHVVWVVRDVRLFVALAPLLSNLLLHCWNTHAEDRIELRLHVTTPTSQELLQELFAKKHPGLLPRITQGRPVWKHLFKEWHQAYLGDNVGVFACGPAKMCHQVKWHCLCSISRGAPFHYHQESFS